MTPFVENTNNEENQKENNSKQLKLQDELKKASQNETDVVETEDAVMVCNKDDKNAVKN